MDDTIRGKDGRFVTQTPESLAKAQAARAAKPRGKRQTKYEMVELPVPWLQGEVNTMGDKLKPKERQALANYATEKLRGMVDVIFKTSREILEKGTDKNDMPKVLHLNKLIDKLLPDIATTVNDKHGPPPTVIFGAMLQRLQPGGAPAALPLPQQEDTPSDTDG